jgi:hypothetical protein
MISVPLIMRFAVRALSTIFPVLCLLAASTSAAELKPGTRAAFERYAAQVEAREQDSLKRGLPFLRIDALPAPQRDAEYSKLKSGSIYIEKLTETYDGKELTAPSGIIHHWLGLVFIPGTTLKQTIAMLEDYDHHKDVYKPEVVDSKLLGHEDDTYRSYMRFYKKKIIGVTLDTYHEAHYQFPGPGRAFKNAHTTKVVQVENAGEKDEYQDPEGKDLGTLWGLHTYWRMQEKDGGVYLQCESVSLSRDIPAVVAWMVKPFLTEVPKESLDFTLTRTRDKLKK